jgi:MFS family permease
MTSIGLIIAGNILAGFGNGMASPALTTCVVNAVSADRHATASGIMQMMSQVGAVAGITVAGAIVAAGTGASRFTTAFLIAAIPAFAAIAVAWFVGSATARPAEPAEHPSALEAASEQA